MIDHAFVTHFASPYREKQEEIEKIFDHLKSIPYVVEFFHSLPVISFILNQNRQIVFPNRFFAETLHVSDMKTLLGLRPGEAFKCIHANDTKAGCGTSENCQVCGAVLTILECQRLNMRVEREASISAIIGGKRAAFDLRVSATPFRFMDHPLVLVSLTDISHEKRRQNLERIFFHDVLNTAGNIHNLAEILYQSNPENQKEFFDLIYIASSQLVEEIKNQKILLEAETGDFVVRKERVKAQEIVAQVMSMFHKQDSVRDITLQEKTIDIEFETDPVLIVRVLCNMMKNALEASEKGDIVVIGCEKRGQYIEFFVHNSAYIPPAIQLQLFQRSVSTKGVGRGLGLYSIKLLAENYLSGKVSFQSSQNRGTTFTVSFPIFMTERTDRKIVSETTGPPLESGIKKDTARILVVDDEASVRKMLRKLLEREGYEVAEASDGGEGIMRYAEKPFDLVLLDIVMPEKEGIETIRELKSNDPDVKIVAMSGGGKGSAEGYLDMAKILGAIHTFAKPVMPGALLETIRRLLSSNIR